MAKTKNFSSRLRLIKSISHKHKKEYGTVVEEYEFNKPEIDGVNYIPNDTIKNSRNKKIRTFEYRCVYDIRLSKLENNEEVILSFIIGYMELKPQFYELSENQKCKKELFQIW